jgi:hypothetical protein
LSDRSVLERHFGDAAELGLANEATAHGDDSTGAIECDERR